MKPQPTSVNAIASTPAKRAKACHLMTLRNISISGSDKAATLIISARVVPTATPLVNMASATGITPVAFEYNGIPVSTAASDKSVWGVATWTDIDQRNDFFSIYVQGLTNAHKWVDPAGAWKDGDPPGTGRRYAVKTLQLNFWRPGDEIDAHEDEIRFGIPGKPTYQYVYR